MFKTVVSIALVSFLGAALIFGCGKTNDQNLPESKEAVVANAKMVKLDIEGMTCTGCEYGVKTALEKIEGVTKAKADFEAKSAEVEFDPEVATVAQMVEAVKQTGFTAKTPEMN